MGFLWANVIFRKCYFWVCLYNLHVDYDMKRHRKKSELLSSNWTIEHDSFLIENSSMSIEELLEHLLLLKMK